MSKYDVIRDPAVKNEEAWRVVYLGFILAPTFNSKGAAQAYLDAVVRGERKPEYVKSRKHEFVPGRVTPDRCGVCNKRQADGEHL